MLSYDVIKLNFVAEGYLPNYPYHLISDAEMCDAFISPDNGSGFFSDYYPCPSPDLSAEYQALKAAIEYHLVQAKEHKIELPDWVQSYMLKAVIGPKSSTHDADTLSELTHIPVQNSMFNTNLSLACLAASKRWVAKLQIENRKVDVGGTIIDTRPPTIFGEPHVIKILRIDIAPVIYN